MARALTGYREYYDRTERRTPRVPRTHPESMARAAGVLIDIDSRTLEAAETDDDQMSTKRQLGTKALVGTMA